MLESEGKRAPMLSHDDVVAIVGSQLDDPTVAAIIETGATREEVMEAAAWAAQESDVMGEERHPLAGVVEQVYTLIVGEDEFPEER